MYFPPLLPSTRILLSSHHSLTAQYRVSVDLSMPRRSGSPTPAKASSSSLRNSLEASVHSKSLQDASLRQSIEQTEERLDEQVYHLGNLTLERPRAVSEPQQLEYYRKLELSNEKTLRDQEALIDQLKDRVDNLEQMNKELMKYKDIHDGMVYNMTDNFSIWITLV